MAAASTYIAVSSWPIAASLTYTVASSLHIVVAWNKVAATIVLSGRLQLPHWAFSPCLLRNRIRDWVPGARLAGWESPLFVPPHFAPAFFWSIMPGWWDKGLPSGSLPDAVSLGRARQPFPEQNPGGLVYKERIAALVQG
jgi:hypothetical protein